MKLAAEQIEAGIKDALVARDFPAVEALLRCLAVIDPDRAERLLTAIKAALTIAAVTMAEDRPPSSMVR